MRHVIHRSRLVTIAGVVALVSAATLAFSAPGAYGGADMDSRADTFSGNATNCGSGKNGIGVGGTLAFANGTNSIDDGNVSGSVTGGTFVNVDNPPAGVNILAIVVKGGPGYNVYSENSGTPPADNTPPNLPPDQNYRAPLDPGGNIPTVSHWFICYEAETPPNTGSLLVEKQVVGTIPVGLTIPTSFSMNVTCDLGGIDEDFTLADLGTFVISGIPDGADCTVTEFTAGLPISTVVTVGGVPTTVLLGTTQAVGNPVTIEAPDQTEVIVTNDFSDVEVSPDVVPPAPTPAAVTVTPRLTG
jgi:hypothetical protein